MFISKYTQIFNKGAIWLITKGNKEKVDYTGVVQIWESLYGIGKLILKGHFNPSYPFDFDFSIVKNSLRLID